MGIRRDPVRPASGAPKAAFWALLKVLGHDFAPILGIEVKTTCRTGACTSHPTLYILGDAGLPGDAKFIRVLEPSQEKPAQTKRDY